MNTQESSTINHDDMHKNLFEFEAKVVKGKCPTCEEHTLCRICNQPITVLNSNPEKCYDSLHNALEWRHPFYYRILILDQSYHHNIFLIIA